eukprot:403355720
MIVFLSQIECCLKYAFPIVLGGYQDDTFIYDIDIDANNRIAIAGSVKDSSVASNAFAAPVPFVGLIIEGGQYAWAYSLDQPGDYIQKVRFSEEDQYVVAMNANAPNWFIKIDLHGALQSIQRSQGSSWSASYYNSIAYFSNTGIVLGFQSIPDWEYTLMFIQDPFLYSVKSIRQGAPQTIQRSTNPEFWYIGGCMVYGSLVAGPVFTIFDSQGNPTDNYELQLSSSPSQSVAVAHSQLHKSSSIDYLYLAVNIDTTYPTASTNIIRIEINPFQGPSPKVESVIRLDYTYTFKQLFGIQVINDYSVSVLGINDQSKLVYFVVNVITLKGQAFVTDVFNSQQPADSVIQRAVYSSIYGYILGGYTKNFYQTLEGLPTTSYTKNVGFVVSFNKATRCLGTNEEGTNQEYQILQIVTTPSQGLSSQTFEVTQPTGPQSYDPYNFALFPLTTDEITLSCDALFYYALDPNPFAQDLVYAGIYIGQSSHFAYSTYQASCSTAVTTIAVNGTLSTASGIELNSVLTKDQPITGNFIFQTNDRTYAGKSAVITVYGYIAQNRQFNSYTVTLNLIQDSCELVVVTVPPTNQFTDKVFDLYQGDNYLIQEVLWTQTHQAACQISYEILLTNNTSGNSVTPTSLVLTSKQLRTSSWTYLGEFKVTVRAIVTNITNNYAVVVKQSRDFILTVVDNCQNNFARTSTVFESVYIVRLNQNHTLTFEAFQQDYDYCQQTMQLTVITLLPTFITISFTENIINTTPTDSSQLGNYTVEIQTETDRKIFIQLVFQDK